MIDTELDGRSSAPLRRLGNERGARKRTKEHNPSQPLDIWMSLLHSKPPNSAWGLRSEVVCIWPSILTTYYKARAHEAVNK